MTTRLLLSAALALTFAAPISQVHAQASKDWPNLARYREANLTMTSADVVFMGDSITDSWQSPRFGGFFPDKPYVDRGISGQTTPQMLLRMRSDVIDIGAKTLVLLAGTNDIAGNTGPITDEGIEANIATMAELARAHGMRVALCSILPVKAYPWSPTLRPAGRVLALNAWMREYARKNGFTFVDYHAAMKDAEDGLPKSYSEDGVHPNVAGYAVMKRVLSEALAGR
jgi:lysophospholipase L1-like esterase